MTISSDKRAASMYPLAIIQRDRKLRIGRWTGRGRVTKHVDFSGIKNLTTSRGYLGYTLLEPRRRVVEVLVVIY